MNINNIMARATKATESMYDKQATIKRNAPYEKSNGAEGMRYVVIHSSVPCRLSAPGSAGSNTTLEEVNRIQYDMKLFLSADYEILPGDEVSAGGIDFTAAKEPIVHISHQEVMLLRKGYA